ncbi:MAG: hypothetical protein J6Q92_04520 [Oscillospiraceae bacterium]|nr:hypothetical protein [Oscillospiraceae bacterium]
MENKAFYNVMKEMGDWIGTFQFQERTIYPFNYVFLRLGMPENSYLADYDDTCDYKRIYLSWYYDICDKNEQMDFEGKRVATPASEEEQDKATELLRKNKTLQKYIYKSHSNYEQLVKEYNLIKI